MKKYFSNWMYFIFALTFGITGSVFSQAAKKSAKEKDTTKPSYFSQEEIDSSNAFFKKFNNGVLIELKDGKQIAIVNPNFSTYSPLENLVVGYFGPGKTNPVPTPNLYLSAQDKPSSYFVSGGPTNYQVTDGDLAETDKTPNITSFSFDISKDIEFRGQTVTACFYNEKDPSQQASVTIKFGKVQTFSHGFVVGAPLYSARNIQSGTTFVTGADGNIIQEQESSLGLYYGAEIFLNPRCFECEEESIVQDPINILNPLRWNFIAGVNVQAPASGFLLGAEWELVKRVPVVFAWTPTLFNTLSNGEVAGEPVTGTIAMDQQMDWSKFSVGIDLYPLVGQTLLTALGNTITGIFGSPSSQAATQATPTANAGTTTGSN